MFEWIASVADDGMKLPHLGDCDNGRVELLIDDIAQITLPAGERHSLRVGSPVGLHLICSSSPWPAIRRMRPGLG